MNPFTLLTVVFITLKLLGYFPYSWWIVFSPFGVGLGITLVFMIFGLAISTLATIAVRKGR